MLDFQNIKSINRAYKKWLEIDILSAICKKKKVGNNIIRVYSAIEEIIEQRHLLVHEFLLDYSIDKEKFLNYIITIEKLIRIVIEYIEETKQLQILKHPDLFEY